MFFVPLRDGAGEFGAMSERDQTVHDGLRGRMFELVHRGGYAPREPELLELFQVIANVFFVIRDREHIFENGKRETLPNDAGHLGGGLLRWRQTVHAAGDHTLDRVRNVQLAESLFESS